MYFKSKDAAETQSHKASANQRGRRGAYLLMDNICNWNIRGLNGPSKQKDIIAFCRKNKIHLLGLLETKNLGPKPFKYFDMWSTDPDFLKVITATWKQRTQGSRMHQITLKLQKLQQPLKKLNRQHFSEIQIKFTIAKENLSTLRLQLQSNPFQHSLYEEEQRLMTDYQLWHDRLEKLVLDFLKNVNKKIPFSLSILRA
ncbi:hypothetical protein Cgig2_004478 [Carnegiea gigantea]|uniref:Uncharacterized protein n=1 Tax=Carnegiea gigantea TaxID=171969 RepID=A0A9Q1JLQ7_9CARY|nr:hypothetical protein Cgig2_004478 [Carnegiea gigantea]